MGFQQLVLKFSPLPVSILRPLLVDFKEIKVYTESSEALYLEGLANHNAFTDLDYRFNHTFETMLKKSGKSPTWAKVTLYSEDNHTFYGRVEYTEYPADRWSENA